MGIKTHIGFGILGSILGSALAVHTYQEKKEEETREEEAQTRHINWQNYFSEVCQLRSSYVSDTDKVIDFCDEDDEKKERDRILEISKGDGSYMNDAGSQRPKREYYKSTIREVPQGFGGDFIGAYAGIPTCQWPLMVKVINSYNKDVCYVKKFGNITVKGRKYNTINLEGQLYYCLREEWRTEHCDTRYGSVVFVQKPDYCKDLHTFQEHIQSTPDEVSLEDWKKNKS